METRFYVKSAKNHILMSPVPIELLPIIFTEKTPIAKEAYIYKKISLLNKAPRFGKVLFSYPKQKSPRGERS